MQAHRLITKGYLETSSELSEGDRSCAPRRRIQEADELEVQLIPLSSQYFMFSFRLPTLAIIFTAQYRPLDEIPNTTNRDLGYYNTVVYNNFTHIDTHNGELQDQVLCVWNLVERAIFWYCMKWLRPLMLELGKTTPTSIELPKFLGGHHVRTSSPRFLRGGNKREVAGHPHPQDAHYLKLQHSPR